MTSQFLISRRFCKAGLIFAAAYALIASAILLSAAVSFFIYKTFPKQEADNLTGKLIENEAMLMVMLLVLLIIGILNIIVLLIVRHNNSKLLKLANINMSVAILYIGAFNLSSYWMCSIFKKTSTDNSQQTTLDGLILAPILIMSLVMLVLGIVASTLIWKDLHSGHASISEQETTWQSSSVFHKIIFGLTAGADVGYLTFIPIFTNRRLSTHFAPELVYLVVLGCLMIKIDSSRNNWLVLARRFVAYIMLPFSCGILIIGICLFFPICSYVKTPSLALQCTVGIIKLLVITERALVAILTPTSTASVIPTIQRSNSSSNRFTKKSETSRRTIQILLTDFTSNQLSKKSENINPALKPAAVDCNNQEEMVASNLSKK